MRIKVPAAFAIACSLMVGFNAYAIDCGPKNNLILEYCFDGDGVEIDDSSQNGFDVMLKHDCVEEEASVGSGSVNCPTRSQGYMEGGLEFTGKGLLNVGHDPLLNASTFTLMAWVRYKWTGYPHPPDKQESRQEVLEKIGSYWLNIRRDGKLRAGFRRCPDQVPGPHQRTLDSITGIPEEMWTHVAVTVEYPSPDDSAKTKMTIYVNGKKQLYPQGDDGNRDGSPCTNYTHPLTIGGQYTPYPPPDSRPPDDPRHRPDVPPNAFFFGTLDSLRIYSAALAGDKITQIYLSEAGAAPRPPSDITVD